MRASWTHLRLDIDLRTEPISGEIGADGADPHRFTGYSGLIAALESIRNDEPPAPAPEAASATPDA